MSEVLSDWIAVAVDLAITSAIVSAILLCFSTATTLNVAVSEQQAISSNIKEYAIHNEFDNRHVYAQDVISAILKHRGSPVVRVISSKGTYEWNSRGGSDYTLASVNQKVDSTVVYDATLVKSANGEVIAYEFKNHVAGSCRVGR